MANPAMRITGMSVRKVSMTLDCVERLEPTFHTDLRAYSVSEQLQSAGCT